MLGVWREMVSCKGSLNHCSSSQDPQAPSVLLYREFVLCTSVLGGVDSCFFLSSTYVFPSLAGMLCTRMACFRNYTYIHNVAM